MMYLERIELFYTVRREKFFFSFDTTMFLKMFIGLVSSISVLYVCLCVYLCYLYFQKNI